MEQLEPQPELLDIFCQAVRSRQLVQFLYRGKERLVAPHAVFRSTRDKLSVSGIEVADPRDPWSRYEIKSYHVPEASDVHITEHPFQPDIEFSSDQAKYRNGVICAMDVELRAAGSRAFQRGIIRPHRVTVRTRLPPARRSATERMPMILHPHARRRAAERGASEQEIAATVAGGEKFAAKQGRTGFRRNFAVEGVWCGKQYRTKQIEVFAVEEAGDWIVITVIVKYF